MKLFIYLFILRLPEDDTDELKYVEVLKIYKIQGEHKFFP